MLPGAAQCFSQVSCCWLLSDNPTLPSDLFAFLESNCRRITRLNIINPPDIHAASFIKAQKHLDARFLASYHSPIPNILSAIESNMKNFKHLALIGCQKPSLDFISEAQNLQQLAIESLRNGGGNEILIDGQHPV